MKAGDRARRGAEEEWCLGMVERAVVEHSATVQARQRDRDAAWLDGVRGGAAEWVQALRGSLMKRKVKAEYFIFF
jgi:hypothetical protein